MMRFVSRAETMTRAGITWSIAGAVLTLGLGGVPSPAVLPTAQSAQQEQEEDIDQLRAHSPAWVWDHASREGYRVRDVAEIAKSGGYVGQLATTGPAGYSPRQVRHAYGFDKLDNDGAGQIIGIVSAFDYPNAAADLKTFIKSFRLKMMNGLPGRAPCTVAAGPHPCFQVVFAQGTQPAFNEGWALESAIDIQWAHAIAQGADILLVETADNTFGNLFQGVDVAVILGASVVSMSWGAPEIPPESVFDHHFFDPAGVTFVAGSGDSGNPGLYPAASPFVFAVGGTSLPLNRRGNRTAKETAWSGSGGGISASEPEPGYQSTFPIPDTMGQRAYPDVAYNADPATGVSVFDSHGFAGATGWFRMGGTSISAPQWAGLIALANELRRRAGNLSSDNLVNSPLYDAAMGRRYRRNYRDVTSGGNGACGAVCTAAEGYDFVTGLGSPKADRLVKALARPLRGTQ